MDWSSVFLQAPVHVLGHFLDRKDFAALQTTSARMQESVRKVLRTRNDKLPAGKRVRNLGGAFCVWKAVKEVLKAQQLKAKLMLKGKYRPEKMVRAKERRFRCFLCGLRLLLFQSIAPRLGPAPLRSSIGAGVVAAGGVDMKGRARPDGRIDEIARDGFAAKPADATGDPNRMDLAVPAEARRQRDRHLGGKLWPQV